MPKMIYKTLKIMPFRTNCYLVASEQTRDGMVIDAAGDASRILNNIQELGLKIGLIVATHWHADHIGAVRQVSEYTGGRFAIHTEAAEILKYYDFSRFTAIDPNFQIPPPPDRLLRDGDFLNVGNLTLQVLYTPGHSAGSICLAGYGVVFSGDTLFNMGIGRSDLTGGDSNLLISNIRSKLLVLPEQTVVLPGHGPKTVIGRERRKNPFLQ